MTNTINVTGTGGIIEGNLGAANVNVNLDATLDFDGSDDFITVADHSSIDLAGGDFTLAFWIKTDNISQAGGVRVLTKNTGSTSNFGPYTVAFNDGNNRLRLGFYNTSQHEVTIPLIASTWLHCAVVYDYSADTLNAYRNGVLVDTQSSISEKPVDNSAALTFGYAGTGASYFDGKLADLRIYNDELSASDIQILASKINVDTALGAGTSNLQLYIPITGTTIDLTDNSSNSNDGTASGSPTTVYDEYSVDVYDNSTTTDGTFTVTQGKVEGKALTSAQFDGTNDNINIPNTGGDLEFGDGSNDSPFTLSAWIKADDATSGTIYGRDRELKFGLNSSDKLFLALYDNGTGDNEHAISTDALTSIEGKWTLVTVTYNGVGGTSANAGINLYVDGVAIAMTLGDSGTYVAMHNDINSDSKIGCFVTAGTDAFDGNIRDFKLFDYELSAEQVASMYSNTYPQTPYHGYKFDEGSGGTSDDLIDYGTSSTTLNADARNQVAADVFTNGTLDLDGTLTIAANGTLSAPRGTVSVDANTDINGTFTHNNGTFEVVTASAERDTFFNSSTFYNLTVSSGANPADLNESFTVINNFITGACRVRGITITMGNDTQSGNILFSASNSVFKFQTNTPKIYGHSSLFPALLQNTGSSTNPLRTDYAATAIHLKNVDVQFDFNTSGSHNSVDPTITLDGDCEFDAVTVSSGDILDLNSQRAEFGGNFSLTGTLSDTGNAGIAIFKGTYTRSGTKADLNTGTVFIAEGAGSSDYHDPVPDKFFVNAGSGTITLGNPLEDAASGTADVILGSGTLNANNQNISGRDDITLATGSTYTAGSSTITCLGDFTTSGGLIGKSALNANDTHAAYGTATSYNSADILSITMSGWFKLNSDFASQETNQAIYRQNDNFLIVQADGSAYCGFELSNAANNSYSYPAVITANGTITADNKWHHMAATWKETEGIKLYLDGKLIGELNDATTGGDFVKVRRRDGTTATVGGRNGTPIVQQFAGTIGQFARWQHTDTSAAKSAAQIRTEMFQKASELSSTTGLYLWFQFDEGTGTTAEDLSPNGTDFTVGTLAKSAEASWAGAGTFTQGTSTVVFAKSGTQNLNFYNSDNFENITINAGSTVSLNGFGLTSGATIDLFGNLVVTGALTDSGDSSEMKLRTAGKTHDFSGTMTGLYKLGVSISSGDLNLPALNTQRLDLTSSSSVIATGEHTFTAELEVNSGTTYNANGNTINCYILDMKTGGTIDLRNSTLKATASSGRTFQLLDSTLLSGNSIIQGFDSTKPVDLFCTKDGNHELVGTLQDCEVQDDGDITVIGSVIRCTFDESRSNIRQWHHTLDTQQLLDADEAGDDDLRLERPALDNANELQTG